MITAQNTSNAPKYLAWLLLRDEEAQRELNWCHARVYWLVVQNQFCIKIKNAFIFYFFIHFFSFTFKCF